jgi:hypothetical protein
MHSCALALEQKSLLAAVERADALEKQEWASVRSRIDEIRQAARIKKEEKRRHAEEAAGQGLKYVLAGPLQH